MRMKSRNHLYKQIEELRQSRVLVYITGDRKGMETQMAPEVIDLMVNHLDAFNDPKRITLILHSRGGETSAGWSIANLIRSFCDEFEVVVPNRAHSAATLLCLGADRIIMTRQATLGPIDPNVNTPLNPQIPGAPPGAPRVGVSVESIQGYVELAKTAFGISASCDMTSVLGELAQQVHPLVLGNVYRARAHIRMLATALLKKQSVFREDENGDRINEIVKFLCSESGSHDYTINRKEARDELGLSVEKPDPELYKLINAVYSSIAEELELSTAFIPHLLVARSKNASFQCCRALIESTTSITDAYISEGEISKRERQTPQGTVTDIQDARFAEGWRKEDDKSE